MRIRAHRINQLNNQLHRLISLAEVAEATAVVVMVVAEDEAAEELVAVVADMAAEAGVAVGAAAAVEAADGAVVAGDAEADGVVRVGATITLTILAVSRSNRATQLFRIKKATDISAAFFKLNLS